MKKSKKELRVQKKRRIRIKGTKKNPRLVVFRSAKILYANLIDDINGKTIVAVDSRSLKNKKYDKETANNLGKLIAKKAKENKIENVVFDRAGYKYHGKVKALADGARKGGLKF